MHSRSVVAGAETVLPVKSVRRFDRGAIDLNTEAGTIWNGNLAVPDLQGLFGQCLAVLQIQCVSIAVTLPGAAAAT